MKTLKEIIESKKFFIIEADGEIKQDGTWYINAIHIPKHWYKSESIFLQKINELNDTENGCINICGYGLASSWFHPDTGVIYYLSDHDFKIHTHNINKLYLYDSDFVVDDVKSFFEELSLFGVIDVSKPIEVYIVGSIGFSHSGHSDVELKTLNFDNSKIINPSYEKLEQSVDSIKDIFL